MSEQGKQEFKDFVKSFPRRCRVDQMTDMERELVEVAHRVEKLGCSPHLTDALNAVHKARFHVADFVDALPYSGAVERGWLIEKTGGNVAVYFSYECGTGAWSYNHATAVRFARKEDAEAMVVILRQLKPEFMADTKVCLHEWG